MSWALLPEVLILYVWASEICILAILQGLRIMVLNDLWGPFQPLNPTNLSLEGPIDPCDLPLTKQPK